jgi:4-diphosphocytidyl-2-C-methyl-D-erythritol kinase
MLRLLGRLCGLELADPRLQEVAARLGSDVPFCLNGGCGLYDRFNDHLLQKLVLPPLDVAIVKPPYGISTAALYRAFDRFCPLSDQPAKLVTAIATGQPREAIAAAMHNNLFAVIEQEHPALCRLAKGLEEESGVLCVVLAGSGSSLIVICESRVAAEALASRYARQGYFSYAGTTIA